MTMKMNFSALCDLTNIRGEHKHGVGLMVLFGLMLMAPLYAGESADKEIKYDKEDECLRGGGEHDGKGKRPKSLKRCHDNTQCPIDAYCEKPMGHCDDLGKCEVRPEICIQIYDPVCGCDGQTYSNACVAASEGISIDYLGECDEPGIVIE
jgi:hypothetical protein